MESFISDLARVLARSAAYGLRFDAEAPLARPERLALATVLEIVAAEATEAAPSSSAGGSWADLEERAKRDLDLVRRVRSKPI